MHPSCILCSNHNERRCRGGSHGEPTSASGCQGVKKASSGSSGTKTRSPPGLLAGGAPQAMVHRSGIPPWVCSSCSSISSCNSSSHSLSNDGLDEEAESGQFSAASTHERKSMKASSICASDVAAKSAVPMQQCWNLSMNCSRNSVAFFRTRLGPANQSDTQRIAKSRPHLRDHSR